MARQGYVNYNRRQRKRKNIGFFIVSAITIVVLYVIVRQFLPDDSQSQQQPATLSSQDGAAPEVKPAETVRTITPPTQPRAVVKPDISATVKPLPEEKPAVEAVDVVREAAIETAPAPKPVKTQEDILAEQIQEAANMARAGKIIEARDALQSLMLRHPNSPQRLKIKTLASSLAQQWLFGDKVLAGDNHCEYYKVQSGDFLSKIGAKYDVPWEFLLRTNNILRPEHLRAGQTIKVVNGPFNAIITRSTFTMDLYLDDTFIKSYRVGLGSNEHQTPTGLWVVGQDKLVSPKWTDPDSGRTYDAADPDYPLGKRWIGLRGVAGNALGRTGFALHGTNEPQSIGQRSSRGCIRLSDEDILEVYDLLMPGKSQVQIVD